jgi:hypothetical protein
LSGTARSRSSSASPERVDVQQADAGDLDQHRVVFAERDPHLGGDLVVAAVAAEAQLDACASPGSRLWPAASCAPAPRSRGAPRRSSR